MKDMLKISCEELREMVDTNPAELEVIIEMLIEAKAELCSDRI